MGARTKSALFGDDIITVCIARKENLVIEAYHWSKQLRVLFFLRSCPFAARLLRLVMAALGPVVLTPLFKRRIARRFGLLFELVAVNPQLSGSYLVNGRLMCRQRGALYSVCVCVGRGDGDGARACGKEMVKILLSRPQRASWRGKRR